MNYAYVDVRACERAYLSVKRFEQYEVACFCCKKPCTFVNSIKVITACDSLVYIFCC